MSEMINMNTKPNIVVTGAAGFLGGRTAKFLASNIRIIKL
jgi:nucleoside-diphosphate-sugar epimerase